MSENTRRSIIEDYGADPTRVQVIHAGVDRLAEPTVQRPDVRRVLFVGIDFERKGGPSLLHAFAQVVRAVPDAELHIVGPRPGAPQPGVVWHGYVSSRSMLAELYAGASLAVLPTRCDPFGLAVVEAMAHALPVIATDVDAMPEIIDDGVTGLLVRAGDNEALADRIVTLLRDPDRRAAMGVAAYARAGRFLWDDAVDRIAAALPVAT
jgi:glycosyltransferase involved in cell wall biosynthesis